MSKTQELLNQRETLKTALKTLETELKRKATEAEDLKRKIKQIEEALAS